MAHTELKSRTQSLVVINSAFDSLPDLQDGFFEVRERLLTMNLEQERRHRKGHAAPAYFSAVTAAKLFVVKHLLDSLAEPNKWTVDDILTIRTECLYAQAYAKKHVLELAVWAEKWREEFELVDYAELMRGAA